MSIASKIKHKLHPQTKDIKNEKAKFIGYNLKNFQKASEDLAKHARHLKQLIKKDENITEEKAIDIAKSLVIGNSKILQILDSGWLLALKLGMPRTANEFKTAKTALMDTEAVGKVDVDLMISDLKKQNKDKKSENAQNK